jgi:hypothetical protein
MLMPQFESLGKAVATAWQPFNFDHAVFFEIATERLQQAQLCNAVSGLDIVEWVAAATWLPQQPNLHSDFGSPPITLFWHPKFYIEALYWTVGTSAVHQHGFSGAFAVLEGSSLQSSYSFALEKRINANMLLGQLSLHNVKLLRKGDVQPIRSGNRLIHSVFHLDSPSVTIVVRTQAEIEHHPQYLYHRPYLAVNQFNEDQEATRKTQVLGFLDQINSPRFESTLTRALESSDLYVVWRILQHLRFTQRAATTFDGWIDIARRKHGPDVDKLNSVAAELERESIIASRRATVTSPEHRFLLALLMNVPSRDLILSMVREHYPDQEPNELVAKWAFEMSGSHVTGITCNDLNRLLFRHLMDGLPNDDVLSRLERDYSRAEIDQERERLIERCEELRHSTIFRPLLEEAVAV